MPSGKTHDKINLVFLPFLTLILWFFPSWFDLRANEPYFDGIYLWVASYLISVFLLSPDLDLHKNRSKKNWGLLRFIWYPYSKIFKHRGISHSLFFGTLTRIFYLYGFYFIGLFFYGFLKDNDTPFWDLPYFFTFINPKYDDFNTFIVYLSFILAGFYVPGILHTLSDWMVSAYKKKK